jgi:hypothetical protein
MSNCKFANITHHTVGNSLIISTTNLDGTLNAPYVIVADTQEQRLQLFNQYWQKLNKGMNCVNPIPLSLNPAVLHPSIANKTADAIAASNLAGITNNNYLKSAGNTLSNDIDAVLESAPSLSSVDSTIQRIFKDMTKVVSYTGAPFFGEFSTKSGVDSDANILRKFGTFIVKNIILIIILAVILSNISEDNITKKGKIIIVVVIVLIYSIADRTYGFVNSFTPATCKAMCKC